MLPVHLSSVIAEREAPSAEPQVPASPCPRVPASPFPGFTGPPIFVSGCNRGGTTILTRLLARHPEVRNIGRGHVCEGQYIWRRRFHDISRHRWAMRPWRWLMRKTGADATPELCAFFHKEFHDAMPSAGRLLEKTPANSVRIPFIDALYPDCLFVHLLRDGRHTTASLIARKVLPLYAPYQWLGAHTLALGDLALLPAERVVLVRYEELMAEPEGVLEELCRRCGLSWRPADRDLLTAAARDSLQPPEARWERFSRRRKRYILRVIGDLQQELGYPVTE